MRDVFPLEQALPRDRPHGGRYRQRRDLWRCGASSCSAGQSHTRSTSMIRRRRNAPRLTSLLIAQIKPKCFHKRGDVAVMIPPSIKSRPVYGTLQPQPGVFASSQAQIWLPGNLFSILFNISMTIYLYIGICCAIKEYSLLASNPINLL